MATDCGSRAVQKVSTASEFGLNFACPSVNTSFGAHFASFKGMKRRRRRRQVKSMLLAGATTFFVPHTGKLPPRLKSSDHVRTVGAEPARMVGPADTPPVPLVTVMLDFRLPADIAYDGLIREAAKEHGVDPALVRAVVRTESGFDSKAVSPAGAQGLMQLMPALSEELGVTDPFDPRENIFAGVRYLRWLLDVHDGDERLALASYNAGPGTVERYQGVPPYPETRRYVQTITELVSKAREAAIATNEP
jgi:soluble lytic murein transglycosylase-like protein